MAASEISGVDCLACRATSPRNKLKSSTNSVRDGNGLDWYRILGSFLVEM